MAISWADILAWETGPLDSIGSDLLEASNGLRSAYEQGEGALQAVQSQGNAITAMRATTISNLASLERALTNVNGALIAIEGARDGVATVMANINALQAYAETNDCTIHSDGSITGKGTENQRGEPSIALAAISSSIKKIIKQADQVDTDLYHALSDINTDTYTDGDKKDNKVAGVADHPQKDWTPSQVAAWWHSLPEKQQKYLTDHCPDEVRHLDGLPASAHDRANRNALKGYFDDRGQYRPGPWRMPSRPSRTHIRNTRMLARATPASRDQATWARRSAPPKKNSIVHRRHTKTCSPSTHKPTM